MRAFSLEGNKSKPSVASPTQALFVPALQQSEIKSNFPIYYT
jgi:hypothetical protein